MSHKELNKSATIHWRVRFLVHRNQRANFGLRAVGIFDGLATTGKFEAPADVIVGQNYRQQANSIKGRVPGRYSE
jgi:hypothetical protein